MKWKLNVKFRSVRSISHMCSLNVLQMTTLSNSHALISHIILWWLTNVYIIKNMFWIFVLKQIKLTRKVDISFLGQYVYLIHSFVFRPFNLLWVMSWENLSYDICEHQRRRSACTSLQSEQHPLMFFPWIYKYLSMLYPNFQDTSIKDVDQSAHPCSLSSILWCLFPGYINIYWCYTQTFKTLASKT